MMIQHLGKIEHIDICFDSDHPDSNSILLGKKGKDSISQGFKFIPGNKTEIKAGDLLMETPECTLGFNDINFAIGSFSTLTYYHQAINKIKK